MFSCIYAFIFVLTYLDFVHGYVLNPSCDPYSDDILTALKDGVISHQIAYYSLATPGAQRADWFGLINSVFPGVMDVWVDEEDAAAYRPPLPEGLASHLLPDTDDSEDEGPYWNPDVADLYSS